MFSTKQDALFEVKKKQEHGNTNGFVNSGLKKSAETLSENGALKYSTTGNDFIDQFSKIGNYKQPRQFSDISVDAATLWASGQYLSIAFILYLRTITRVVKLFNGDKTKTVQRGAGLKHEAITRMVWLHVNHKEKFWKNIGLFISVGSWKDVFVMLSYDLQYNGWDKRQLNWDEFGKLILSGLENPNTSNLVKKYLPQIKSNSKCRTLEAQADNVIAKWICSLLYGNKESSYNYKKYRKIKTSGTAHEWQKLISQGKHDLINFDTVHGRALALMVSGKYIDNNNLTEKYEKWISSKPIAKYTGYAHELFEKLNSYSKKYQIDTLNAQFMGLVDVAKQNATQNTSMIIVRDTSGSMSSIAPGTKSSCFDIAKSLGLFFSYMLPSGYFSDSWIEFNRSAMMHNWKGNTPVERWNADRASCIGDTNFQSVIDLFCQIKRTGVPENEFPTGIVCISDGEFNPTVLNKTNVEVALQRLSQNGFSQEYINNFKIVLWNLQSVNRGDKFETFGTVKNVYYFSGFDGSIIALLTGAEHVPNEKKAPETAEELFKAAMDQEVFKLIEM